MTLLIASISYGQSLKSIKLVEGFNPKWEISMAIQNQDTTIYMSVIFQNKAYEMLKDYGVVTIIRKTDVELFIANLREIANNTLGDFTIENRSYKLTKYGNAKEVYFQDAKGKYTTFTVNRALKLADILEKNIHVFNK